MNGHSIATGLRVAMRSAQEHGDRDRTWERFEQLRDRWSRHPEDRAALAEDWWGVDGMAEFVERFWPDEAKAMTRAVNEWDLEQEGNDEDTQFTRPGDEAPAPQTRTGAEPEGICPSEPEGDLGSDVAPCEGVVTPDELRVLGIVVQTHEPVVVHPGDAVVAARLMRHGLTERLRRPGKPSAWKATDEGRKAFGGWR